jgi:LmbE family N-acetylglucosaminyl deacetylase
MTTGEVVLLSPHLDDAVLSAWSVLRGPGPVRVVNVFAGSPSPTAPIGHWDARTGAEDSPGRVAERIAEDRVGLALAGREPLNLGFLDDQYRDRPVPHDELVAGLAEAVAGATALHAAAGIRGHVDHLAVRVAATTLAHRLDVPLSLYAEQPYATRYGWPSWICGEQSDGRAEADWEPWVGDLRDAAHVERLDPAEIEAKLNAMRTYRTQFAALEHDSLRGLADPAMCGIEVRFRRSS